MDKKDQAILFWVLTGAAMLLLLLYSPWGSPDMYDNRVYFADNQGVNFNNRIVCKAALHVEAINAKVGALSTVVNAPKNGTIGDSQNAELNVPDNYSKRKTANKISSTNYTGANSGSNRIIAYNKLSKFSVTKRRLDSNGSRSDISNDGNSNGSSSSNSGSFASNNNINSSVGGAFNQSTGVSAVNVDLSLLNDSTVMEAQDSAQRADSDPGDNPIPVPEGWGFLLALAAIYIVIKRKMFLRLIENKSIS